MVDGSEASSTSLAQLLGGTGAERVMVFQEPVVALGYLASIGADLLVVDVDGIGMAGIDLVERARVLLPDLAVIVLATTPSVDIAVGALRARVDDLLIKPLISREPPGTRRASSRHVPARCPTSASSRWAPIPTTWRSARAARCSPTARAGTP